MPLLKRTFGIFAGLLVIASSAFGQSIGDLMKFNSDPSQVYNGIAAGAGMSIFGDKPYFLIHVAPQFEVGKWGFGFDGNFRIDPKSGKFRKEDFDETYDIVRFVNFVSFGKPWDSLYVRVGGLHRHTVGNGTIVNNYSNNSSYDERRVGLAGRLDLGTFGAEGMMSDMFRPGIYAIRPFIKPFKLIPLVEGWVWDNIEIGATGAFDYDSNATKIIPNTPDYVTRAGEDSLVVRRADKIAGPLSIYGMDLTVKVWQTEQTMGKVYGDYVKIGHFNDGFIAGTRAGFAFTNVLMADLTFERSFFRNKFLPYYYNSFYERDRLDTEADSAGYITKLTLLNDTTGGNGNGWRAGGYLSMEGVAQVILNYSHLDNLEGHDVMDIYVNMPEIWWGFFGSISYSKKNILSASDAFTVDDRSLLTARVSIPLMKQLYGSIIARWTFERDERGQLQTRSIIEPKADFIFRF